MYKLNIRDKIDSLPPVIVSVLNNDYDYILYRLEKRRLNIDKRYELGFGLVSTLLQVAVADCNEEMIAWLIDKGANISDKYEPAIFTAIRYSDKKIIQTIIDLGGLNNLDEEREREVLSQVGYSENYSMLDIFESNGKLVSKYGDELLVQCIDPIDRDNKASLKLLDKLIKMGININASNNSNSTPLMSAIFFDNIKIANKLLDAGADVTIVTNSKCRAYTTAIEKGNVKIANRIKLLESKDLHDIELQTKKFHSLGCPEEMIDFFNGEKLELNFSKKCPIETIMFFSLEDAIVTKWKTKKIIRLSASINHCPDLIIAWMVTDKKICAIDTDHDTLYLLSNWNDFIANAESLIIDIVFKTDKN